MFLAYDIILAMKNAQKSDSYEPTLADVLEAVQTGFAKVEERFDGVDERFEGIEGRLSGVETVLDRHNKLLKTLVEGQANLQEQLNDNTNRLIKTQNRVEDIADILEINHEHRITRLEKALV